MINFGSSCSDVEFRMFRVIGSRLPMSIGHESRYNFLDLKPKMKLMWLDKIHLIMT